MENEIIKKLLLQKKYGRYKYLFSIKLSEIEKIGIKKFYSINLKLNNLKEKRENLKYFRLENRHKEYFENNKEKILIEFDNNKIDLEIIKKLTSIVNNIQFIYKINTQNFNEELEYIDSINPILYVESEYKKNDIFWIKKNLQIFKNKEVLLSLNKINKQENLNNEFLFETIKILKSNNSHINLDFIRLESASEKIYAIGPKELHIDLSEFCNTNCNFCVTNGPDFLKRDITKNNYKITFSGKKYIKLFKDIEKSGTESLALGITGEPFLHPDIKYILDELKNINIKQGFLTNGYKLLENIEFLIQNKHIEHLYINISSGNLESFQATRKGDNFLNFLNTWSAINILREKRPDIIIRCLYVITPQNLNGIEDFIKLSVKNNINEIELKRVVPYEFSEDKLNFSDLEIKKVLSIIKKSQKYLKENEIKINENFDYIISDFKKIIIGIQAPESSKINKKLIEGLTNNCYNPYFYLSILRNDSFSCGKFIGKIGKLSDFNLYNLLFEKKEIKNIILGTENLKNFLGENIRKEKCSRCHHMDVNNMVSNYLKIKQISINLKKGTE